MKRDEAFELAIQWRDDPTLLVGDLRAAMNWLWQNSDEATDAVSRAVGVRTMDAALRDEAIELLMPLHKALAKYTVLIKTTKLTPDLLVPVIDSLMPDESAETDPETSASAIAASTTIAISGLNSVVDAVEFTQRWVDKQVRLQGEEGNRSEILKTTIEIMGDELLVKTDQDGSLKLRGSANIPMFLAFFRTAKHFLDTDTFLDIDRTVKSTNLDRHRVRLSCKLHDVLIEIVSEKGGYRMQKFKA
jgi:hypothetical protein